MTTRASTAPSSTASSSTASSSAVPLDLAPSNLVTAATGTTWAATALVLRRFGFGATGREVDQATGQGVAAWSASAFSPGSYAADAGSVATPAPVIPAPQPLPAGATKEQRAAVNETYRQGTLALQHWWLRRMLGATNPTLEKLTFGWHDHFATAVSKVRDSRLMLQQNDTLRAHALGSFTDLAHAMVVDPAVIRWLDGERNTVKAPNENLARELLELFTLGHGDGYTETDVREAARALTGWLVTGTTAQLDARRHDSRSKTVLTLSGNLGATDVVDAALAQPAAARYLVTRWWHRLVGPDDPSDNALARVVAAYGPGRDTAAMFRAMAADPELPQAAGSLVVSPVDWVVGAGRALGVPTDDTSTETMLTMLRRLGQVPFDPPNVSGWPSGPAWLSTTAATTRLAAAQWFAAHGHLEEVADAAPTARAETTSHLLGLPGFGPRTTSGLAAAKGDPARIVATALVSPEYLVA